MPVSGSSVGRRGSFDLDGIAQERGQAVDPPLEDRLFLARRFVFGVLPQIAELAGGSDSGDDDRPLHAGELLELGADAGDAARGEVLLMMGVDIRARAAELDVLYPPASAWSRQLCSGA